MTAVLIVFVVLALARGIELADRRGWFARCVWFGHDHELQIRSRHVALRCVSCGKSSPGWTLDAPPVSLRARVIRFRKRVERPHLIVRHR